MSTKRLNHSRSIAFSILFGLLASACAGPNVPEPDTAQPSSPGGVAGAGDSLAATPALVPFADTLAPVVDRDGRMIVEAMEYPWSAIGRLNTGGRGFCSGVLIGPRLVLTSAQCLFDAASGRWWPSGEIHFVAGYQQDRSVIHAGVQSYEVAPDFVPGTVNTFANLANNWALISLDTPIGYAAGWLAVQWQNENTRARLAGGDGFLLAAGYRRGQGNAVTIDLACAERACAGSPVEAALPAFVYLDEEFRVLGTPLLRERATVGAVGSADFAKMLRGDTHWGESKPPVGDVIAAALPRNSVSRLLRHLGHLEKPGGNVDERVLATAIRDFENQSGLRRSGALSVALLGQLLEAAVRHLPHAKLRPQSHFAPVTEITHAAVGSVR